MRNGVGRQYRQALRAHVRRNHAGHAITVSRNHASRVAASVTAPASAAAASAAAAIAASLVRLDSETQTDGSCADAGADLEDSGTGRRHRRQGVTVALEQQL